MYKLTKQLSNRHRKFLCTDKDQNIILQNTEEFLNEVGESGRLVGMVMVPGEHIKSIHIQKVRPGHLPKLVSRLQ